jgi:hypothetical protein
VKQCTVCKIEKPLLMFSPEKRIASGVQSRCKTCYATIMRNRRSTDPANHRDAVKRSTKKNYKAKLQRNQEYRRLNPDKVSLWKKADRTKNKARVLADNANRRALVRGELSPEIVAIYCLRDFYREMSLGEDFHVDHIIPLIRGGKHCAENLQVIPAIDNLRKGKK